MFQIQQAIDARLMGSNKSRTFYTQAILPGASVPIPMTSTGQGPSDKTKSTANNPPLAAKNMVRTDAREQKLEKFLVSKPAATAVNNATIDDDADFEKASISNSETNQGTSKAALKNSIEVIEPMDTSNNSHSMIYKKMFSFD